MVERTWGEREGWNDSGGTGGLGERETRRRGEREGERGGEGMGGMGQKSVGEDLNRALLSRVDYLPCFGFMSAKLCLHCCMIPLIEDGE